MTFCVGSEGRRSSGASSGPGGTFHAVRIAEAFDGVALCGARVQVWPGLKFPSSTASSECTVCRAEAEKNGGPGGHVSPEDLASGRHRPTS